MTAKRCFRALSTTFLLILVRAVIWAQGTDCPPGCSPGRWSREAVDLSSVRSKAPYEARDIRVLSPDKQNIAHIVNDRWWIEIGESKISLEPEKSLIFYPAELGWAPNSRALYITEGTGYTTGYTLRIYFVDGDKLHEMKDVNSKIQDGFARRHKCTDGELPNVAGMHWADDSLQLLVVAEQPPISICKGMYYFGGYSVSMKTGKIVERYSPEELEMRWKDVFGDNLKNDFERLSKEEQASLP